MRLSIQFKIILAVFTIVLVVISASILATSGQISQTRTQENLSNSALQGASELTYLSNQYVIYREDFVLSRWQSTYTAISNDIGNLTVNSPDQQALVQEIKASQQNMKTVFDSIVAITMPSQNQSTATTVEILETSWSRMAISSQTIITDSTRLAQLLHSDVDQLNLRNIELILAAIITFSIFIAVIYLQIFRRTLKSISELQAGTKMIGSGDLDYKLNESSKDEIGDLSRSFNQMTFNLKAVTASKTELEQEVAQRKQAEEALRQAQLKLQEYAANLERLVEQRTKQLKESERMVTIGQTAGMVGHDIRNPLQAIIGDLYLLKIGAQEMLNQESRQLALETIDGINENIGYINKIVADLQDYARQTAPKIEEVDLESVIDRAFSTITIPQNIETKRYVEPNTKLKTDPTYIRRIITNLSTNAIQAMPNGGKLTVEAICRKQDKIVQIIISDTGPGIPKEVQDKLFTPLFTTKSKGQGFGLAVVKKFVEELGGTISFESQEGKGTKFIVNLPAEKR